MWENGSSLECLFDIVKPFLNNGLVETVTLLPHSSNQIGESSRFNWNVYMSNAQRE